MCFVVAKIRVLSTNGSGNNHSTIKQETTTTDKNVAAKSTSNHDTRRKIAKQNYDATARKPNQKCDPYGQNGKPLEYEEASQMMKTTALEPGWKIQSFTMINNNKTENENDNNCSSSLYNHPLCLTKEFHHADFMQGSKFLSKIAAVGHINNHFPYLKLERRLTKKSWDVVCVVTCFTAPLEGLSFNDFHIAMLIDVEKCCDYSARHKRVNKVSESADNLAPIEGDPDSSELFTLDQDFLSLLQDIAEFSNSDTSTTTNSTAEDNDGGSVVDEEKKESPTPSITNSIFSADSGTFQTDLLLSHEYSDVFPEIGTQESREESSDFGDERDQEISNLLENLHIKFPSVGYNNKSLQCFPCSEETEENTPYSLPQDLDLTPLEEALSNPAALQSYLESYILNDLTKEKSDKGISRVEESTQLDFFSDLNSESVQCICCPPVETQDNPKPPAPAHTLDSKTDKDDESVTEVEEDKNDKSVTEVEEDKNALLRKLYHSRSQSGDEINKELLSLVENLSINSPSNTPNTENRSTPPDSSLKDLDFITEFDSQSAQCIPCPTEKEDNSSTPQLPSYDLGNQTEDERDTELLVLLDQFLSSNSITEITSETVQCIPCPTETEDNLSSPLEYSNNNSTLIEQRAPSACFTIPEEEEEEENQSEKQKQQNSKNSYTDLDLLNKMNSVSLNERVVSPDKPSEVYESESANPFILSMVLNKKKSERSCFGHKETIFGLALSPCGKYLATAGQDAKINIWNTKKNSLITALKGHDVEYECLRVVWASETWSANVLSKRPQDDTGISTYTLASSDANGQVKVWHLTFNEKSSTTEATSECFAVLDHSYDRLEYSHHPSNSNTNDDKERVPDENIPQIYAIQFIDKWLGIGSSSDNGLLITSSDDKIHLWELIENLSKHTESNSEEKAVDQAPSTSIEKMKFRRIMSFVFVGTNFGYGGVFVDFSSNLVSNFPGNMSSPMSNMGGYPSVCSPSLQDEGDTASNTFGGVRNPDKLVFVFDASMCPSNNLLGVALSDGTLRILNARGVCLSILQLPGCNSHLTALAWDDSGSKLATCVGTGHLILWGIEFGGVGREEVYPSCKAIFEGGHDVGRPLFGAKFCQDNLLSWGVDGKLCLWNGNAIGNVTSPLAVLISKSDYPIYAVDIHENFTCDKKEDTENSNVATVAAGGGVEGGFIGVPVYLYDIESNRS